VGLDDLPDAFSGEGLLPESGLDLVQDLLVTRLGLVKDCKSADAHESLHLELTILESLVSGTQSVTEVLSEDQIQRSSYARKGCREDSREEMILGRPDESSARWVGLGCWERG
jgi:hypothetical protein